MRFTVHFESVQMPLGLEKKTLPSRFSALWTGSSRHLPWVFSYVDDHLIASGTWEENLQKFCATLQQAGLRINPTKCVFVAGVLDCPGPQRVGSSPAPSRGVLAPASATGRDEVFAAVSWPHQILQVVFTRHRRCRADSYWCFPGLSPPSGVVAFHSCPLYRR